MHAEPPTKLRAALGLATSQAQVTRHLDRPPLQTRDRQDTKENDWGAGQQEAGIKPPIQVAPLECEGHASDLRNSFHNA